MRPYEPLGWVRRHTGLIAEFRTHHHRAPDGSWVGRDRLHLPPSVVVLPVVDEDVLLVEQWRDAAGKALLEVPAGRIEPGEDPATAAARECEEEVGWSPNSLAHLGRWFASPGISTEVMEGFVATGLTEVARRPDGIEEEASTIVRLSADEAVAAARSGALEDLKTVTVLLAFEGHRQA